MAFWSKHQATPPVVQALLHLVRPGAWWLGGTRANSPVNDRWCDYQKKNRPRTYKKCARIQAHVSTSYFTLKIAFCSWVPAVEWEFERTISVFTHCTPDQTRFLPNLLVSSCEISMVAMFDGENPITQMYESFRKWGFPIAGWFIGGKCHL